MSSISEVELRRMQRALANAGLAGANTKIFHGVPTGAASEGDIAYDADNNNLYIFSDGVYVEGGNTGENGLAGVQSANGTVYYTVASSSNPGMPSATAYNFSTGVFTGLTFEWSKNAIAIIASNSSFFWRATYEVTEATAGGTQTITFSAATELATFENLLASNVTITENLKGGDKTNSTDVTNDGYFFNKDGTAALGNRKSTLLFGNSGLAFSGEALTGPVAYRVSDSGSTSITEEYLEADRLVTQTTSNDQVFSFANYMGSLSRNLTLTINVEGTRFSPKETSWTVAIPAGTAAYTSSIDESTMEDVYWKADGTLTLNSAEKGNYNFLDDGGSGSIGKIEFTITADSSNVTYKDVPDGPEVLIWRAEVTVGPPLSTVIYIPNPGTDENAIYTENGTIETRGGNVVAGGNVTSPVGNFQVLDAIEVDGKVVNASNKIQTPSLVVGQVIDRLDPAGTPINATLFSTFHNTVFTGATIRSFRAAKTVDSDHIRFYSGLSGTAVGAISTNGIVTTYGTSSDYRLKENVVALTGSIEDLKKLNPIRFNFINTPDKSYRGFLAHEVQDIIPDAVIGIKDGTEEEPIIDPTTGEPTGETQTVPNYQGVDHGKLTPLLTGALQEAITKIEELEARIIALEN